MSLTTTVSGKPCKLCKKKGDLCHVHEQLSPRSSSKSISPKKSPKRLSSSPAQRKLSPEKDSLSKASVGIPTEFYYLEQLPIPSLEVVMMNMERPELNRLCNTSKRAKKICDSTRFKEAYPKSHPLKTYIFRGPVTEMIVSGGDLYVLSDELNTIYINTEIVPGSTRRLKSIIITFSPKGMLNWDFNFGVEERSRVSAEIRKTLLDGIKNITKKDVKTLDRQRYGFYKLVKNEIEKAENARGKPFEVLKYFLEK